MSIKDLRTGFIQSRFCGSFAGVEVKRDERLGTSFSKVTFMTMKGKKYVFKVLGECADFSNVPPFGVVSVDVFDVEIGKAGEYGNYGDQSFNVTDMKLVQERVVAAPAPLLQKAA